MTMLLRTWRSEGPDIVAFIAQQSEISASDHGMP